MHCLLFQQLKCFLLAVIGLLWVLPVCDAKQVIFYPQAESTSDTRSMYPIKLLELALSKSGGDYDLQTSVTKMAQGRTLIQLAVGADVDVAWSMTSKQREHDLLPIRIPIDKGLLGWRIFLINHVRRADFAQVQSLDQLKKYQAGQGHDWPDTEILRANGLPTIGEAKYEGLFKLLQFKLCDYFPRSIAEIWDEEKNHPNMELEIENTIVLRYPTALYFFVNKKNTALAASLDRGLHAAIKDGSFDQLFYKYNDDLIRRADLKHRKVFTLNNPLLPAETPLRQKQLWYEP